MQHRWLSPGLNGGAEAKKTLSRSYDMGIARSGKDGGSRTGDGSVDGRVARGGIFRGGGLLPACPGNACSLPDRAEEGKRD